MRAASASRLVWLRNCPAITLRRDSEEPRPRLGRNVVEPPPCDEEGLRRDVLRPLRIDPQRGEPQHGAEVLAVDPLEPLSVIRHRWRDGRHAPEITVRVR